MTLRSLACSALARPVVQLGAKLARVLAICVWRRGGRSARHHGGDEG
jgi:hypothetical protein